MKPPRDNTKDSFTLNHCNMTIKQTKCLQPEAEISNVQMLLILIKSPAHVGQRSSQNGIETVRRFT